MGRLFAVCVQIMQCSTQLGPLVVAPPPHMPTVGYQVGVDEWIWNVAAPTLLSPSPAAASQSARPVIRRGALGSHAYDSPQTSTHQMKTGCVNEALRLYCGFMGPRREAKFIRWVWAGALLVRTRGCELRDSKPYWLEKPVPNPNLYTACIPGIM